MDDNKLIELRADEEQRIKESLSRIGNLEAIVTKFNEPQLFKYIVEQSFQFFNDNNKYKKSARKWFSIGIAAFVLLQYGAVVLLILLLSIPEAIMIALISGVLLETLGMVVIMVKFLFNDETETEVIKAIQNVADSYKKSNANDDF
jgi:hypothetical protein